MLDQDGLIREYGYLLISIGYDAEFSIVGIEGTGVVGQTEYPRILTSVKHGLGQGHKTGCAMRRIPSVLRHEFILHKEINIGMCSTSQTRKSVNSLELDDQFAIFFRGPYTILFRDPLIEEPAEQLRIGQERRDERIVLEMFIVIPDPQDFPAEL